jgi:hypothetical protein
MMARSRMPSAMNKSRQYNLGVYQANLGKAEEVLSNGDHFVFPNCTKYEVGLFLDQAESSSD